MKTRSLRRKIAGESGQSVTELAMMMWVIFPLFFWAFQAQIILTGVHQTAYASYAAARTLTVKHKGAKDPQKTMKSILTGKIFKDNGEPSLSETQRGKMSLWNTPDGVEVSIKQFASLPWARGMLNFD